MTAKTASCTARKASLASANVREVADREEDPLPRSRDTLHTAFFATSLLDVHCNGCSHRAIFGKDELATLQSPVPVAQAQVRPATFRSTTLNIPLDGGEAEAFYRAAVSSGGRTCDRECRAARRTDLNVDRLRQARALIASSCCRRTPNSGSASLKAPGPGSANCRGHFVHDGALIGARLPITRKNIRAKIARLS